MHLHSRLPLREKELVSNRASSNLERQERAPALCHAMTDSALHTLLDLRGQFLAFLRRRVDDTAVAEDLLQTAYVRALESSHRLRADESVVAWFYRILRNAIIDNYRRRTTENAALERWALELTDASVTEPQLFDTTCRCIESALQSLKPGYAELLREVDLGEGGLTAYADRQKISPANAAVRAHRARAGLRKQLIQSCGACSEHGCIECTCRAAKG